MTTRLWYIFSHFYISDYGYIVCLQDFMPLYRIIPWAISFSNRVIESLKLYFGNSRAATNVLYSGCPDIENFRIEKLRYQSGGTGQLRPFCHCLIITASVPLSTTLTLTHCELTGWRMFLNLFSLPRGCWLQAHLTLLLLFLRVQIRFCSLVYIPKAGDMAALFFWRDLYFFCLCCTWFLWIASF